MIHGFKEAAAKLLEVARSFVARIGRLLSAELITSPTSLDREIQISLAIQLSRGVNDGCPLPHFTEIEFSRFSQNGEDGILLFIFTVIKPRSKTAVEIGSGDGIECNTANLIINHGWSALLLDGNRRHVNRARSFYRRTTNAWRLRRLEPKIQLAWITKNNINELIETNGFSGEVDLLSIDIDGVDYWIWRAITCIQPRLVVVEYNNRWTANESVTVPYEAEFQGRGATVMGEGYFGASLPAFVKLGLEKGYRLVGANSIGTNAFFMRNDIGRDFFPEVTAESCLSSEYAIHQQRNRSESLSSQDLIPI